ncbi:MAG TPA: hypothetical protein VK176_02950 [Phycisphaerales bacterium]|nr:hypothetical protein [Phycisphaerales bacterium]
MQGDEAQKWPVTVTLIIQILPVNRMAEVASHFRIRVTNTSSWESLQRALLADPAVTSVPLLHLLSRREIGDVCRLVEVTDEGPTQMVLAQLLPLCPPTPARDQTG